MIHDIENKVCEVLRQYPVSRAALFGSVARGNAADRSDVDMLVEFLPGTRGILFFGLRADLEEALNLPVDLLTYNALYREAKPEFREAVLRDEKVIYEQQT
jgi:predicted nucleotidyltransferase